MQVSIESSTGLERQLKIGVPAERIDQEVTNRLQKATKTVSIKGFRKGKVPLKVVKQHYGKGVRQEVVGEIVNSTFYEAIQQEDLKPVGQPQINELTDKEGQDKYTTEVVADRMQMLGSRSGSSGSGFSENQSSGKSSGSGEFSGGLDDLEDDIPF